MISNVLSKSKQHAEVAELADAQASGACGSNIVWVQVPSSALQNKADPFPIGSGFALPVFRYFKIFRFTSSWSTFGASSCISESPLIIVT